MLQRGKFKKFVFCIRDAENIVRVVEQITGKREITASYYCVYRSR